MYKNIKNAFVWYFLYKFRKTFTLIAVLLAIVLFSQWIYADVVEYLTLREKLIYLDIILPLKWGIIFFNIGLSVFLFLRLFKGEKENKQRKEKKSIHKEEDKKDNLSAREKEFLYKKSLKNRADILVKGKQ